MGNIVDFCSMSSTMTRNLNSIAEKYRRPYTEFIDRLSKIYDDDTGFWWDTPLASRNVYLSWCFQDICVLRLILDYITKYELNEVIVSCDEIKEAIMCNRKNMAIHVPDHARHDRVLYLKRNSQAFCRFKEKIYCIQKYRKNESLDVFSNRNIILVGVDRVAAEIQNGVLQDRYFKGLQENSDEDIVFLSMCGVIKKGETQLLDVLHDRDDHICIEDWIEEQDFCEIQRYIHWTQSLKVEPCSFDGMDVTVLLKTALLAGGGSENTMYGIARGEALCRIVDQYKLNIKCLIDWFEGQASSHATIRRFRRKFPMVPTVACAPFPHGENNLGQYPSKYQIEKKIVAEYFGIMGEIWKSQVCQFSPNLKCIKVPSFYHKKIFDMKKKKQEDGKGILIVLPYFRNCATELLMTFGRAIQALNTKEVGTVYIKNHPVNQNLCLSDYGIDVYFFRDLDVVYLAGDMSEAMKGKKMIILSKTTSTLENMLSGVYTVSFVPSGDLSTIALPKEMMSRVAVVYNADDLRTCLQFPQRGLSYNEVEWFREISFTRVNRKTVTDFLHLCCTT